ncbi:MAG TPA: ABC transporter substrate-binding protein [Kineosporiaceae bacterium]|nr:ABC transporter substrate-binding protein [Kineosporiaceae bacterium]
MTRPNSEAEYLARMVPASVSGAVMGRRGMLKTAALGAGAAFGLPAALAACGGDSTATGTGAGASAAAASGAVTIGSNQSDPVPKQVLVDVLAGFKTANPGIDVTVNTVDHNTFQENINNYLQGRPDDAFTWFAGYRARFFASKGLAGDISDVWKGLTGYTEAFKTASTGDDGKQYFVPVSYYPWAVFYRKSLWKKNGYTEPKTLDEFTALCKQMQTDGLEPLAFADKDGWPAMGMFDILNMRVNGYQYHVDLMAGKEAWDSPQVTKVFDTWTSLIPYQQKAPLGRTWQEAAQSLQQKKTGMCYFGLFIAQQFKEDEQEDLDFFTFPEIDSVIGSDALDAPIDGWMMAKKPKNEGAAKAFLGYLGTGAAGTVVGKSDPGTLAANSEADTASYGALKKKAAEIVGSAKSIAQFLDRDTRPDFASTVMIPSIQSYLKKPADIASILKSIEAQKKSIFTS